MLEKVFTTSEVHFLFSTTCFQNVTEKWQLSHERFCKTLLKQMLSCSNIQQSATPACTRDAHSFIAGPVLQPPAHVEDFITTPLWKKTPKPALSLFLIWFYQQLERWLKAGTKISARNKRQNPTLLPLSQEQHCRPEQEAQGHHKNFAAVFVPATPQPHILESPRSKQLCCLFCRTKIQKQGQTKSRGCAKSLLWMRGAGVWYPTGNTIQLWFPAWLTQITAAQSGWSPSVWTEPTQLHNKIQTKGTVSVYYCRNHFSGTMPLKTLWGKDCTFLLWKPEILLE